jgi:4-amino-4-deoxy-L-arabinose transferase-like glycosyltransferase
VEASATTAPVTDASGRRPTRAHDALVALLLFAVTFAVASFSVQQRQPLGDVAQLTDEWYWLGLNLASVGTLGLADEPILLRPPGYPLFIAAALRLFAGTPGALSWGYFERGQHAVFLAQALLLAATTAALYLWQARHVRRSIALVAASAFGLNPYTVVLTGLMHYDVLHLFFLVAGAWTLGRAFAEPRSGGAWLGAGLVWGLATLVRSVTLLLPPLVLAALWLRGRSAWTRTLRSGALFAAGLAIVILPWTVRNYALSGRIIPVNDQGWAAIWGSTTKPLGVHPNHYKWASLGRELSLVERRVSGRPDYDYLRYVRATGAYEAAFREEALRNLRRSPGVYLENAASGLLAYCLHINSVFIKTFQYRQTGAPPPRTSWFTIGHPQDFHPGGLSSAFSAYAFLMTGLAAAGMVLAWRRREARMLGPGLAFACIALGHAISYMDLMYYYQRVPFLFLFPAFLAEAWYERELRLPRLGWRLRLGPLFLVAIASGMLLTPIMLA